MVYCGPSCAVPTCYSAPIVGFGSAGSRGLGCGGLGYGGLGFGGLGSGGLGSGLGSGYGAGGLAESARNLGTLAGVNPRPINQVPSSEVTIQPPAVVVTIPGPILSASCEPVAVGGYNPCAPGGIRGIGAGYYGGRLGRLGRRGSIICDPCNLPC
ncbi:chorion class B protein B.L1-like [Ahaetulla prasina]|uniref:chorion class B protein B.L1-like n=1 Tax=Ahaetulla prasina TaxID=499056 RepID=UPI002649EA95|nr:chorion class B protein B.L1-like [Ahaetulla prasina]